MSGQMGELGPPWVPLALIVPALTAYGCGVLRLAARGDRWAVTRTLSAGVGLLTLTAALLPPLVTTMSFPLQVLQHLLLAMLAPLALALGAPVTLALRTLPRRGRMRLLGLIGSRCVRLLMLGPVVLVLEVGGMYLYYLTGLFAYAHSTPWAHLLVHTHMFLAGCLLSWYVAARDPMPRRPSVRGALVVLFLAAGCHDLLAKLMYARLLPQGGGTPDQVRAGAHVMFYGGDLIELLLAATLMSQWYARTGRRWRHERRRVEPGPAAAA